MSTEQPTIGSKAKLRSEGSAESTVLTIPKAVMEESDLENGDEVYVTTDGGNVRVSLWE